MIQIINRQRTIPVNTKQLKKHAQIILDILGYSDFDLGIMLCNQKSIRSYNQQFRSKDKVTDVLSFPYHDYLQAGQTITAQTDDDKNLGDIILCPAYITQKAEELGVTLDERIEHLVIHSICHLLGHEHETDKGFRRMRQKEVFLKKKLEQKLI